MIHGRKALNYLKTALKVINCTLELACIKREFYPLAANISQASEKAYEPTHQPLLVRDLTLGRRRQRQRQKAIALVSKTTTLLVHHAFLYISLPSLHDYNVK